jgi:Lysophospholipase
MESMSFDELKESASIKLRNFDTLLATDGVKLAYYLYANDHAIATLIFFHGGGAYSGAGYQCLAQGLSGKYKVNTILVDLRGHGNSGGRRGGTPSVKQVYKDIDSIIDFAHEKYSGIPLYAGGHSSGCGLLLNYASYNGKGNVDGYFFLSPYFGYTSKTDRENCVSFTKVPLPFFILNGMSWGLLFGNANAVQYNYSADMLASQPLLTGAISVNMSKSMTPTDPVRQFGKIDKKFGMFIGSDDELFDPEKISKYSAYAEPGIRRRSVTAIVQNCNHLSILLKADILIGDAIAQFQKD